jgi:hypothetical protein
MIFSVNAWLVRQTLARILAAADTLYRLNFEG